MNFNLALMYYQKGEIMMVELYMFTLAGVFVFLALASIAIYAMLERQASRLEDQARALRNEIARKIAILSSGPGGQERIDVTYQKIEGLRIEAARLHSKATLALLCSAGTFFLAVITLVAAYKSIM